jgi:hypothetical protein
VERFEARLENHSHLMRVMFLIAGNSCARVCCSRNKLNDIKCISFIIIVIIVIIPLGTTTAHAASQLPVSDSIEALCCFSRPSISISLHRVKKCKRRVQGSKCPAAPNHHLPRHIENHFPVLLDPASRNLAQGQVKQLRISIMRYVRLIEAF